MRWEVASVSRPCTGEHVSGDGVCVIEHEGSLLATVTDGLGHGPSAAEASVAFIEYVTANPSLPLGDMMLGGSKHIGSTRGAAASLMRFNPESGAFSYCGVGNCHLHTHVPDAPIHPVSAPGIVGNRIRKVLPFEFSLPATGLFVLCSDGISSRLHVERYAHLDSQGVVDAILDEHGKHHDDATILVVRLHEE